MSCLVKSILQFHFSKDSAPKSFCMHFKIVGGFLLAKFGFVSMPKEKIIYLFQYNGNRRKWKLHNSQVRVSINLAEKISSNGIQRTYQSIYDNVCIHIKILSVGWDTKKSLPIVCWLLLKSFCKGAKTDIIKCEWYTIAVSVKKKNGNIYMIINCIWQCH